MIRFIPFLESYLKGGRQLLYHWTESHNLIYILRMGKLGQPDVDSYDPRSGYSGVKNGWVSFTRNKNYRVRGSNVDCRFTFDGDILRNKYKIRPYADGYMMIGGDDKPSGDKRRMEAEEVVDGPINLKDGCILIELDKKRHDEIVQMKVDFTKRLANIEDLLPKLKSGKYVYSIEDDERRHGELDDTKKGLIQKKIAEVPGWMPMQRFNADMLDKRKVSYKQTIDDYEMILDNTKVLK